MSINFKPINELPEVESVSTGDKLILNSGGAAKQIDASKFAESGSGTGGGGTGGGNSDILYVDGSDIGEGTTVQTAAYADKDMTIPMTYAQGKAALLAGNVIVPIEETGEEGGNVYMFPIAVQTVDSYKIAMAIIFAVDTMIQFVLMFSDSEVD